MGAVSAPVHVWQLPAPRAERDEPDMFDLPEDDV